jgi:hypothetical protein
MKVYKSLNRPETFMKVYKFLNRPETILTRKKNYKRKKHKIWNKTRNSKNTWKITKLSKPEVRKRFFISKDLTVHIATQWLLQEKKPVKTLIKIWVQSNDQIKRYGHFELLF